MQTTQLPNGDGLMAYAFNGMGPRLNVAAIALWDYVHSDGEEMNREIYGDGMADHVAKYHSEAVGRIAGYPTTRRCPGRWPSWRATTRPTGGPRASLDSARRRSSKLETIVGMTPHMSVTAMYSDYVLPVADHYEREDFTMEGRTPYVQAISEAVPPLGESKDDWDVLEIASLAAISEPRAARGIAPGRGIRSSASRSSWDYTKFHEIFTTLSAPGWQHEEGHAHSASAVELHTSRRRPACRTSRTTRTCRRSGIIRSDDSDGVQFGKNSNYSLPDPVERHRQEAVSHAHRSPAVLLRPRLVPAGRRGAGRNTIVPREMSGGRLQPAPHHGARAPRRAQHVPRRFAADVSLQRGEPDVFVNPDDAAARGVADGDLVRVYNNIRLLRGPGPRHVQQRSPARCSCITAGTR